MRKRFWSLLLVLAILIGCFSAGIGNIGTLARNVGVGTGAESFNPVAFSLSQDVFVGTDVNLTLNVEIIDSNYRVRINSVEAYMPYYTEGGIGYLSVDYSSGVIVTNVTSLAVSGKINTEANSVVRYTIGYDILDKTGKTIWKNLTGYKYGLISGNSEHTGPVGTYHSYPGSLSDGCYFEVLETLNTVYVQQSELALLYKIRTQSAWSYSDPRTRGVNIISGNAPSTVVMMPDNLGAMRQGQMDWPRCGPVYRSAGGDWLRMAEPASGYYNFTISFNSWGDEWEDQSNITETTEMYYITNADRVATLDAAEKITKTRNTFSDGYYVQKGFYTEKSWNNFINALDIAYQVALSVPNANYGYKLACQQALSAASSVEAAFAALEKAGHDFYTYKDPVVTEATCTEAGSQFLTCICGEEKTEVIPANGHIQGEWNLIREATCTAEGLEELKCTVCNAVIKQRILGVIAHNYQKVVTPPSCTERGFTTNTCSVCADSYTSDYVDEKGHSYESTVAAPTCTEKGYTVYICYGCSASYVDNYTDIVPHDYETAVVEPTETTEGYTIYTCKDCGHTYNDDFVSALVKTAPVSGTVKTFGTNAADSEIVETKIELIKSGEETASYTVTVSGTGVQNYTFESVNEGIYIIRVSKANHATREYEITVSDEAVTAELVIHLLGDINGDGRVNTIDTARANAHAKSVTGLDGYEHTCADINADGKVNTIDTARINAHAKSTATLW